MKTTQAGVNNTTGGGGRKVFSLTRTSYSDTDQELVFLDTYYRGIFEMYQGYGNYPANTGTYTGYNPIATSVGSGGDYNLEPGSTYAVSPGYCSYQSVNGGNKANCWVLTNNEWITYYFYVLPSSQQTANGRIIVNVWVPGMSGYAQVMDSGAIGMQYGNSDTPGAVASGYNAGIFWIYDTGSTGVTSPTYQYYDQLIVSSQPIAVPLY